MIFKKMAAIAIFSAALGFVEAAVVLYLRALYYPGGFSFPLKIMPVDVIKIEIGREISTIVILAIIGSVAGKTLLEKGCYFLYAFGIWDIFYYFWLKVILDWPPSLMTWDLLFLIPVPWVAPVLAPLIVALTLILMAAAAIYLQDRGMYIKIGKLDLMLFALAGSLIFVSFVLNLPRMAAQQLPVKYHWELLILGELFCLDVMLRVSLLKTKNRG